MLKRDEFEETTTTSKTDGGFILETVTSTCRYRQSYPDTVDKNDGMVNYLDTYYPMYANDIQNSGCAICD